MRKIINLLLLLCLSLPFMAQTGGEKNEGCKEEIFIEVEKMPEFRGGIQGLIKYISSNVKYPNIARESGIEGKVYIRFCVTKTGAVSQVSVARGVDPILDKEAARVVKSMPKWTPGEQKGEKVNVWYTVPINFQLTDNGNNNDDVVAEEEEEVYLTVDEMPKFPGGDEGLRNYISSNVKYPNIARESGIEGTVYVRFCISTTGEVCRVSIARGVDPILDKEAVRVVKTLPKWKPGILEGKKVNVWYTVPINFQLQ